MENGTKIVGPVRDYLCVDLETTGLNPKTDKIIEIGAVKVKKGEIIDTFATFVRPGKALPERIRELTGIAGTDLEGAPLIGEVLPQFLEFAEELPLLGHSILFDYSFLKRAAVNAGRAFEKKWYRYVEACQKISARSAKQKAWRFVRILWDRNTGAPGAGGCSGDTSALPEAM